ncbi:hypothetical protein Patl1_05520 [Pistacia atlantica]|uniref:Uncharacterized protein n=1 Tax=Pistacia atlantica TaxID=434234 RepID=A0ACC1BR73_9ROSI|nr:hypothetical protein Patl1_05520 [Pistacia atlantica]
MKFKSSRIYDDLFVTRYVEEWEQVITRTGRWIDFRNDYKTMDFKFMESVWWVFAQLYEKGLVYRGFKVSDFYFLAFREPGGFGGAGGLVWRCCVGLWGLVFEAVLFVPEVLLLWLLVVLWPDGFFFFCLLPCLVCTWLESDSRLGGFLPWLGGFLWLVSAAATGLESLGLVCGCGWAVGV